MPRTADIQESLALDGEPVAIAFLQERPPGVPAWDGGPVAAGCVFWRAARRGRTFYTEPADHYSCAVGSHVHGIALPVVRAGELAEAVTLMADSGYLDPAEVPSIPTVDRAPRYIAYGPAGAVPFDPDVVVVAATPAQAMLLHEAGLRAGVTPVAVPAAGRPGCAVLPLAMQSGQSALSLGCAGNRISTGLDDAELYTAIPGSGWTGVVEELGLVLEANAAMGTFYRDRSRRVQEPVVDRP